MGGWRGGAWRLCPEVSVRPETLTDLRDEVTFPNSTLWSYVEVQSLDSGVGVGGFEGRVAKTRNST